MYGTAGARSSCRETEVVGRIIRRGVSHLDRTSIPRAGAREIDHHDDEEYNDDCGASSSSGSSISIISSSTSAEPSDDERRRKESTRTTINTHDIGLVALSPLSRGIKGAPRAPDKTYFSDNGYQLERPLGSASRQIDPKICGNQSQNGAKFG